MSIRFNAHYTSGLYIGFMNITKNHSNIQNFTKGNSATFQQRLEAQGWELRQHLNDTRFRLAGLTNCEVAFSVCEENGQEKEYRGKLEQVSETGSALFRLEGESQIFNANCLVFLAKTPERQAA